MLDFINIYETIGVIYEMVEQAEQLQRTLSSGLAELEEKIAELREETEALLDDLAPAVADNPE